MELIAEVGQAHDGSLGILHSYIDAVADLGVPTIKFQTHIADAESSVHEQFRVNFSYQDKTRQDYWKRTSFSQEQWLEIKKHCDARRINFLATPFSVAAVDLLDRIGIQRYKVGSGDIDNLLMLERISATKKPVILSSGMSSFAELENSINFLKDRSTAISLLQCTTKYPTPPLDWGLNVIEEMKQNFCVPVGFSDHSGDIFAPLAAATLGAEIIEAHVVFSKKMFGPDTSSSLDLNQLSTLHRGLHDINVAL